MWLPIWPIKRTEMNEIAVANRAADWRRLKALVLDSVSSPITKRVYNLGLDEFIAWYELEPRPGFTKATVSAWRVALEARGLGAGSINVRLTAVRKLAVGPANPAQMAPISTSFPNTETRWQVPEASLFSAGSLMNRSNATRSRVVRSEERRVGKERRS